MKKVVAIAILFVLVCTMAFTEETAHRDVTYRTLYNSMIQGVREDDETDTQLKIENATVWKISDNLAGFTFQGEGWQIIGETDMETGIITRLFCRMPYSEAGLLMTYTTAFVLSEETSTDAFIKKYVGDQALLNGNPFPHYVNTLDAGNGENIVYEFTRIGSMSLENDENRCEMKTLIEQIQRFE